MRGSSFVELTGDDGSAADTVSWYKCTAVCMYTALHLWYIICTGTAVFIHISCIYT